MFFLAIVMALYAYGIFFLGLTGLLNPKPVEAVSLAFIAIVLTWIFLKRKTIRSFKMRSDFFETVLLILLGAQALVNLVGALGPELAFDALWYHLTLPKLYLLNHRIIFYPGWLFNYSAMPKLTEMLYAVALMAGNENGAKLIHFLFGILILIALYKVSRKFLNQKWSLLTLVVFYGNLVVGWMSITAYIDLARTFYELLAFLAFLRFAEVKKIRYYVLSAVCIGLAISTKILAVGSLAIYIPLFLLVSSQKNVKKTATYLGLFVIIALMTASPWFIFSYLHTGNPVYPIFSGYSPIVSLTKLLNPVNFIRESWKILLQSDDPISPIYLMTLPLIFLLVHKFSKKEKIAFIYSLLAFFVWYVTPRTGGGRFILPYLPVFSFLVVLTLSKLKNTLLLHTCLAFTVLIALISIGYRGIANKKYVPVITGNQSKSAFLRENLNFHFGDFYDIDGYFAKTIKPTDRVLIYGVHNLYYVNFPFVHESFLKPEDMFDYILVGNGALPQKYAEWILIYQNNTTKVKLFKPPRS